jgi:NAD-dependent SIR2 family protein deacetylase
MINLIRKLGTTFVCRCDKCNKNFRLSAWGWKHRSKTCPYCENNETHPEVERVSVSDFEPLMEVIEVDTVVVDERKIETEKIINKKKSRKIDK